MSARVAEYRDVKSEPFSERTALETGVMRQGFSDLTMPLRLMRGTPGWEPAGSMARWTDGYWSVEFTMDHVRHARRYATEEEARAAFDARNLEAAR